MKTLVIQSFRTHSVPPWIERCLVSVRRWAAMHGYDYRLTDDRAFDLCGPDYLARVGDNLRSITNLCRLELVRQAHADGYELAAWVDADVFVFDAAAFTLDSVARYAFARETWLETGIPAAPANCWRAVSAVNNSVFACRRGEPDLAFLIDATRHVARHRQIRSNYQVGGDLIKGLRASLDFELLDTVGMFSSYVVLALAREFDVLLKVQARCHGNPVHAANLCASANYLPVVGDDDIRTAMDRLEATRGGIVNDQLSRKAGGGLVPPNTVVFDGPPLAELLAAPMRA
jgi:hypothetical protein